MSESKGRGARGQGGADADGEILGGSIETTI